ncbi:MFS transporter (plasmid) [Curtobacterium sp. YC1]|nr:MFS transporter [Curtobacterium sp. YC1]
MSLSEPLAMTTDVHFTPDTDSIEVVPDAGIPAEGKRLSPGEVLTISVLVFSAFVAFLSEMVMGVALPQVMDDLDITATTGQWLTTGYALTLAVIIPTTGYVMARFPLRTIFIASVGMFTLGTAIAAIAPGFELLLTGRIVQAVGTAVLVPLLMTTSIGLVAPSRRGQMMALVTAVTAVAPAVGPAVLGPGDVTAELAVAVHHHLAPVGPRPPHRGDQDAEPHHTSTRQLRRPVARALRGRVRCPGLRPGQCWRGRRAQLGSDLGRAPAGCARHCRLRVAPAPAPTPWGRRSRHADLHSRLLRPARHRVRVPRHGRLQPCHRPPPHAPAIPRARLARDRAAHGARRRDHRHRLRPGRAVLRPPRRPRPRDPRDRRPHGGVVVHDDLHGGHLRVGDPGHLRHHLRRTGFRLGRDLHHVARLAPEPPHRTRQRRAQHHPTARRCCRPRRTHRSPQRDRRRHRPRRHRRRRPRRVHRWRRPSRHRPRARPVPPPAQRSH